ncbi:MAG TPA: hypothetical protein VF331_16730 [Polyangiales bacterium]
MKGFSLRDAGTRLSGTADAGAFADASAVDAGPFADAGADGSAPHRPDAGARADGSVPACTGAACVPHSNACADRSRDTMLLQLTRKAGFCAGECQQTLTLAANGSSCDQASLSVCGNGNAACTRHNVGVLSATAHQKARTLAAKLVGTQLAASYGCPGCADETYATLALARNSQSSMHTYDVGSAPAELAEADAFLGSLLDALNHCSADPQLTLQAGCTPAK